MITLITYPAGFGQFSLSPFCVKAGYLLAMSGQSWQREDSSDPRRMPHAKLPVIRTGGQLIHDTTNIRLYLEQTGVRYDAGLSDCQKAQGVALTRMSEEHLYFHLVLDRWANDDVWPTIRETYFAQIPWIVRKPVTNRIRKALVQGLKTQGLARFSRSERMARVNEDFAALTALLWQNDFLMGAQPSVADLSVAPVLSAMRATPVETELSRRVANDPVLSSYLDRMDQALPLP